MTLEGLFLLKGVSFAALLAGLFVVYPAIRRRRRRKASERALEERFGEAYLDYRRRVPRWLFRLTEEDLEL